MAAEEEQGMEAPLWLHKGAFPTRVSAAGEGTTKEQRESSPFPSPLPNGMPCAEIPEGVGRKKKGLICKAPPFRKSLFFSPGSAIPGTSHMQSFLGGLTTVLGWMEKYHGAGATNQQTCEEQRPCTAC